MGARGYDAVVEGAGHDGLVAAADLARAGWSVPVLERLAEVGGAEVGGAEVGGLGGCAGVRALLDRC